MAAPLRSASQIAAALGIDRQRLNVYVQRAAVEPVAREGSRRLYDAPAQARILDEFHEGQVQDAYFGGPPDVRQRERAVRERLYRLALEVDRSLVEEWASLWSRGRRTLLPTDWVRRLLAGTLEEVTSDGASRT